MEPLCDHRKTAHCGGINVGTGRRFFLFHYFPHLKSCSFLVSYSSKWVICRLDYQTNYMHLVASRKKLCFSESKWNASKGSVCRCSHSAFGDMSAELLMTKWVAVFWAWSRVPENSTKIFLSLVILRPRLVGCQAAILGTSLRETWLYQ